MKKKSIKQLKLKKSSISTLNGNAISGGNDTGTLFCPSNNFCETIDYSACRGEYQCQIYKIPTDQNF
ncbi:hypothetical protein KORDIASMS9_00257 [Kordia sp. SMS9]|uniref:hypothetical protein n=1 Tax=Kordia sp. SMS9 TaxID=2282170 RepID=UPI000E0D69B2|nr:hypothetical protein [Kordia sp. SMS9]AXG68068.1 hypothetical protein KORDIASMS9_00257 [Kordia sp. SMS9]